MEIEVDLQHTTDPYEIFTMPQNRYPVLDNECSASVYGHMKDLLPTCAYVEDWFCRNNDKEDTVEVVKPRPTKEGVYAFDVLLSEPRAEFPSKLLIAQLILLYG